MEKNLTRISTRSMSRQAWLAERRKTIGGSDAAGIVGLSRYATPYAVWADKTGRLPEQEDNEAMRQGRDLEEYVAKRWEESTGKRVRRSNALLYNPSYPFAHADIDRTVLGEDSGPECKTTSALNLRQFRNVEFPEQYYVQCVHYLAVTGCQRWYLAVLVFGRGFFTFTLERDQAEIDALMAAEEQFWALVEQGYSFRHWTAWRPLERPCKSSIPAAETAAWSCLVGKLCSRSPLLCKTRKKNWPSGSAKLKTPSRPTCRMRNPGAAELTWYLGKHRPGGCSRPRSSPWHTRRSTCRSFIETAPPDLSGCGRFQRISGRQDNHNGAQWETAVPLLLFSSLQGGIYLCQH